MVTTYLLEYEIFIKSAFSGKSAQKNASYVL